MHEKQTIADSTMCPSVTVSQPTQRPIAARQYPQGTASRMHSRQSN
ncbi:MAG TPA: hypothetical protein VGL98_06220 [Gammaproteobacteria bacterium]